MDEVTLPPLISSSPSATTTPPESSESLEPPLSDATPHPHPADGGDTDTDDATAPGGIVAAWAKEQLEAEKTRVRSEGAKVLAVACVSSGTVREGRRVWNRVELDSSYDFRQITQLLTSPPTLCPHKPGFAYITVILVTAAAVPFLVPYVYKRNVKANRLTHWVIVNNRGQRVRHVVKEFTQL